ncbi:MAG TPA: hypothetical protein VFK11_04030 [Candidatus Saccharimonadales bacterium]|nr:hypothetical protein [Candidatus Saccharimonadales bacterium]
MVDSDKPDERRQQGPLRDVDPKIEAKVDEMMNEGSKKNEPVDNGTSEKNGSSASGAPLLPGEKLPDFGDKYADEPPQVKKPEAGDKTGENEAETVQETPGTVEDSAPEPRASKQLGDDPATGRAVDDIVQKESDRMLAMEDAKAELLAEGTAEIDRGFFSRLKGGIGAFWRNKWTRWMTLLILLSAVIAGAVMPQSRYFILNAAGVRASLSLRVVDDKTRQPLKNVEVSIDDLTAKTDKAGNVKLEQIKLGEQILSVKKPAFADINRDIVVGWGSNPLGDVGMTAVGSRYKFEIVDYVSGKAVTSAEAVSGDASARADKKGEIILVVADQDESDVTVHINAKGYREAKLNLKVGDKQSHLIKLVPDKKHAFVSKRSGKYDLYKIDADGKNEQVVLEGTGEESEDGIFILPDGNSNLIAYVSTRGDKHSDDGTVLSDLMLIDLGDNSVKTVDYSERIQPIGFIGGKLVYARIVPNEADDSSSRQQIIAYDVQSKEQKVLTKANYFNDLIAVKGAVYYAPSAYKSSKKGFFSINPDGSGKKSISGDEAWSIFRTTYDKLDVAVGEEQDWYEYDTVSGSFNALNSPPPSQKSRLYTESPDGKKAAWVDERDGKGVLIIYDISAGQDNVLYTQSGLSNPVSWLDDQHLVYRVSTSAETADYVISISGGKPKKIRDVTNTAGLDRWYYY